MAEYVVKNSGAPYFRWVDGAIKARQGNLTSGKKVSGSVSGKFLVIPSGLSGEAPLPYAMYLTDLEEASVEPPVDPPVDPPVEPPTEPSSIVFEPGKLQGESTDGRHWQNDVIVTLFEASG